MASKRRSPDSNVELPNPKHRNMRIDDDDDVEIQQGNKIKSEEDFEDAPCSNPVRRYKSIITVGDTDEQVKDEPVEVKDEPTHTTDHHCSEPGWDICGDEKPVIYEIPVQFDEIDPLRPLTSNREVKDEPMEDKVKPENDDGFEENISHAETSSSAKAADVTPEVCDDTLRRLSATTSHKAPLRDPPVLRQIEARESRGRTSDTHHSFLSFASQQPSTSGLQTPRSPPERLPKRSPPSANGPRQQNTNKQTVKQMKGSESGDLTEPQGDGPEPQFEGDARHPSSKPLAQQNESEDSESSVIIQLLVDTHFPQKAKTKEQENAAIRAGRPTPTIRVPAKTPHSTDEDGLCVTKKEYQLIPWLTGSKKLQKYYCWPCLLFTRERWTVPGGINQNNFWTAIKDHNENSLHKAAYANLKLRECELKNSNNEGTDPCDIVKANRAILELLIRILCSKKTKLHNTDSNFDGYEELMKVAISQEPKLHQCFGKPFTEDGLIDFVTRHASKLLSFIGTKIAASISEEIRRSQFVSIVYEDTVSITDRSSQVAVIIRLLTKDGDICERFVKMVKIGSSRNAYDILEIHLAVIEELGISEKLVGFTFTGTVVAPTSIAEFITIASKNSPKARFFHHPDHNLKELLLQSLSHLEECKHFLKVISELVKFLTTNSGAIPTLVTFIKHNVPNCPRLDDARCFTTDIISTIRLHYPLIIQFFSKVSEKFWNDEVAKQAPIFMKFLLESPNRFLISVIATVLDTVEDLSKTMEKDYDSVEWTTQAQKSLDKLHELYDKGANHYVFVACKMPRTSKDDNIDAEMRKGFLESFRNIIKTALNCVYHRARKSSTFYLNGPHNKTSEILQAPENWSRYGFPFDSLRELQDQMDFNKVLNAPFNKKSIPEIVKAVEITQTSKANLKSPKFLAWQGFIRFCAMAIPPTKSTTAAPSTVLKLKYYLKDKHDVDATEVLMFLERGILCSQLKTSEFVEEVITEYAKKNKHRNFLYDSPVACQSEIDMFEQSAQ